MSRASRSNLSAVFMASIGPQLEYRQQGPKSRVGTLTSVVDRRGDCVHLANEFATASDGRMLARLEARHAARSLTRNADYAFYRVESGSSTTQNPPSSPIAAS